MNYTSSMNNSIHLAIDAVGGKFGGIAAGLVGILEAALNNSRVSKITLFCTPLEKRLFKIPSAAKLIEVPKPWVDKNYALRILWYKWLLGLECKRIEADVLLASDNYGTGGFGVPYATYVRQSLPFSHEALDLLSMMDRFINKIRKYEILSSCRNASKVICQSAVMKDWLTDSFGLDPAKVVTVYSPPKRMCLTSNAPLLPETNIHLDNSHRLLYVGSDYPYKKLDTAVYGMELIRKQFSTAQLTLTLPINHRYASFPGVKCIGYLNDEQLAEAYISADILVLPSLVESGPQPPYEAMTFGIPVLIADRPYAHDICCDAAIFFDPNSPADFAEKAIQLLTDEALRQTLIERGFDLVEKRRAEQPFKKIIDIVVECALKKI